jgi:hypothetical protein
MASTGDDDQDAHGQQVRACIDALRAEFRERHPGLGEWVSRFARAQRDRDDDRDDDSTSTSAAQTTGSSATGASSATATPAATATSTTTERSLRRTGG